MSNNSNVGLICVDDGGSSTCVVTRSAQEWFPSVKSNYGKRNLISTKGKHDYVVDYLGERYILGTLALYDSKYPLQMHSRSKNDIFFDLSVLTAIHKYGYLSNMLVVTCPIKMLNEDEVKGRIQRLKKTHTITVNGNTKTFAVNDVIVSPETASAYWVTEPKSKVRWIDLGSRTVGYGTTINENGIVRFIDTESGTFFGMGLEGDDQYDPKFLARYICGRLLKIFDTEDLVHLIGGGALDDILVGYIKEYFPNAQVFNGDPRMANALGGYNLGRYEFGLS